MSRLSRLDIDDPLERLTRRVPALGYRTVLEASVDPSMAEMVERVLSRWEEFYGQRCS